MKKFFFGFFLFIFPTDPEQLEAKRKRNNPSFEQNFALEGQYVERES